MTARPYAFSLLIHVAVITLLVNLQAFHAPRPAPSEYQQKIAGKESKIIWFKLHKDLPPVRPPRPTLDHTPLRAELLAKQSIVSSPKNAPKRTQMIWTPAPQIAPVPLPDSPNLLAIKAPELPPPPAKAFAQPPSQARPPAAAPQLAPDAPLLQADAAVRPAASFRLPPKPYLAPPPLAPPVAKQIAAPNEAPRLTANLNVPVDNLALTAPKLPPRPFTAPITGAGRAPSKTIAAPDTPPLDAPANSQNLNVAIVGLNPVDRPVQLPVAPSPAAFSAGAQLRPTGATSEGAGKALSVPDLFVRPHTSAPDLIADAYAAPTSSRTLRAALARAEPTMTVHLDPSVSSHPGATKVSGAPDPRFNGRDVYLMAIQMPNLTSYSGSWLMWYSARTAREAGLAPIAAPVPHRKVDPRYVATAAEERIEGKVQLACVIDREGKVSSVELIRGIDDRLNQSAREALAKWEFYPAARNGEPVEVDVLVEIPFKLAPRSPDR